MSLTTLVSIVAIIAGISPILMAVAGVLVWYYGRKDFAPAGVEKRLREFMHSKLGQMEITAAQRHDALVEDIREMKEDVREALSKAHKAYERASEARHVAMMAERSVQELREGVAPLRTLETRIARIEGYIERATNTGNEP